MATEEVLMGIEITARKRQIEVTTMQRGKGRHRHYGSLNQAPPEVRGEALELIRAALQHAGYDSLTALETALTSELVVPEKEAAAEEVEEPAG
jgi:hypothetical protein